MNANFRWLVEQAHNLGRRVIDQCNLTLLMANGFKDPPELLVKQDVEIVASLPCYLEENCDSQRGDGVFKRSIDALRRLNTLGYGHPGSGRKLTLVYNPTGISLPPAQDQLEEYLQKLIDSFNPLSVDGLMCRTMISVDWQGHLFDCDFNQMLHMGLSAELPQHISDFDADRLTNRDIETGRHCFGCTAGSGSSCQGAVVKIGTGS